MKAYQSLLGCCTCSRMLYGHQDEVGGAMFVRCNNEECSEYGVLYKIPTIELERLGKDEVEKHCMFIELAARHSGHQSSGMK